MNPWGRDATVGMLQGRGEAGVGGVGGTVGTTGQAKWFVPSLQLWGRFQILIRLKLRVFCVLYIEVCKCMCILESILWVLVCQAMSD